MKSAQKHDSNETTKREKFQPKPTDLFSRAFSEVGHNTHHVIYYRQTRARDEKKKHKKIDIIMNRIKHIIETQ